jgi:hypothetical protein
MPRPVSDIISTGLSLMSRVPAPDNFKLAGILTFFGN